MNYKDDGRTSNSRLKCGIRLDVFRIKGEATRLNEGGKWDIFFGEKIIFHEIRKPSAVSISELTPFPLISQSSVYIIKAFIAFPVINI